ncbi:MAG: M12 family metallopeptidase [bacterium]|nr:M12 family metallopeptidase [bacterium]
MKMKQLLLGAILCAMYSACSNEEMLETNEFQNPETDARSIFEGQTAETVTRYYRGREITVDKFGDKLLFEGDIVLNESDVSESPTASGREESVGRIHRNWPKNEVYYIISSENHEQRILDAIAEFEANTPLRFYERTNQPNYIEFLGGGGLANYSSSVGMNGGRQTIVLGLSTTGTVIHEIGHAIGLWHEHTRSDRNNYVEIQWQNIRENDSNGCYTCQFEIKNSSTDRDLTTGLDFGSIMMYSNKAFSKNGQPTITKIDGSSYSSQRSGLSTQDISGINQLVQLTHINLDDSYPQMGEWVQVISTPTPFSQPYTVRIKYTSYGQVQYQTVHTNYGPNPAISTIQLWSTPGLEYSTMAIEVVENGVVMNSKNRTLFPPASIGITLNDSYPRLGETVSITSVPNGIDYSVRIKYTLYGQVQYQHVHNNSGSSEKTTNVTLWTNPGLGYSTIKLEAVQNGSVKSSYSRTIFP